MFPFLSLVCFAGIVWILVDDPEIGGKPSHKDDGDDNALLSALIGMIVAPFLAIGALLVFLFQFLIAIGPFLLFVIVPLANLLRMAFYAVHAILRSAGGSIRSVIRSLERSSILRGFLKDIRSVLNDAVDVFRDFGRSFSAVFFRAFTVLRSLLDAFANIVTRMIGSLRRISVRGIASAFRNLLDVIRMAARQGIAALDRVLTGTMKSLHSLVQSTVKTLSRFDRGMLNGVKPFARAINAFLRTLFSRGIGPALRELFDGMRSAILRVIRSVAAFLSFAARKIISFLRIVIRWALRLFPFLAAVRWGTQSRSSERSTERSEDRESERRSVPFLERLFSSLRGRSDRREVKAARRKSAVHAVHGDRFSVRRQQDPSHIARREDEHDLRNAKESVSSRREQTSKGSSWVKRVFAWASQAFSSPCDAARSFRKSAAHAVHGDRFIRRQQGSTAVYVGMVDGKEVRITMTSLPAKEKRDSMILPHLRQIGWWTRAHARRLA